MSSRVVLLSVVAAFQSLAFQLLAEDVVVTEAKETLIVDSGTITPSGQFVAADELPDIGVTPIFHLDASETNGWTFVEGSSGELLVTKAPSKVGTRVLNGYEGKCPTEIDSTDNNSYWKMHRPDYVANIAELGGKGAISCGAQGSGKVLLFDKGADGVGGSG